MPAASGSSDNSTRDRRGDTSTHDGAPDFDLEVIDDLPPPSMPGYLSSIPDFEEIGWTPLRGDTRSASEDSPSGRTRWPEARRPWAKHGTPGDRGAKPIGPATAFGRGSIAVGLVVAVTVIAGLILLAELDDDLDTEDRERLDRIQQTYLPSFDLVDGRTGEAASQETIEIVESVEPGTCYGWLATATENQRVCDLDLILSRDGLRLAEDQALDNFPVLFYCPERPGEVDVILANLGGAPCSYAFGRYRRQGSLTFPLDTYLDLYLTALSVHHDEVVDYTPEGMTFHGQLGRGDRRAQSIFIPRGSCRTYLAISQLGSDLDLALRVGDEIVSEDTLADNYPVVGFCADNEDVRGEIELHMFSGSSAYVWQAYVGPPPGSGRGL